MQIGGAELVVLRTTGCRAKGLYPYSTYQRRPPAARTPPHTRWVDTMVSSRTAPTKDSTFHQPCWSRLPGQMLYECSFNSTHSHLGYNPQP